MQQPLPQSASKLWSLHKEMHGMAVTPTFRDHPNAGKTASKEASRIIEQP